MLRAGREQVLEDVREPRAVGRVCRIARLVANEDRHDGHVVVLFEDDGQTIGEMAGRDRQSQARGLVGGAHIRRNENPSDQREGEHTVSHGTPFCSLGARTRREAQVFDNTFALSTGAREHPTDTTVHRPLAPRPHPLDPTPSTPRTRPRPRPRAPPHSSPALPPSSFRTPCEAAFNILIDARGTPCEADFNILIDTRGPRVKPPSHSFIDTRGLRVKPPSHFADSTRPCARSQP